MVPEKSAALTTPTARVTATTIQSWLRDRPAPGERQSVHRVIPGLDLYISAHGPGSWVARLQPRGRTPEGKRWPLRFLKIGNTDTHALTEAIAELRQLQLQVMHGRDPGAERREAVQARAAATAAAAEASAARTSCRQALDAYQSHPRFPSDQRVPRRRRDRAGASGAAVDRRARPAAGHHQGRPCRADPGRVLRHRRAAPATVRSPGSCAGGSAGRTRHSSRPPRCSIRTSARSRSPNASAC